MTGKPFEYAYEVSGPRYDDDYVVGPVLAACRAAGARRVLDLGCGNGAFCARLHAAGFDVVGVDPSESGIRVARESVPGIRFERLGVDDDPGALGMFDVVVAVEVVEHLYLPRALPAFAKRVLVTGGLLILTTPYHGYLKNVAVSALGKWDAHHDPLWAGGHIKFWSAATLRRLVEPEGFDFLRFQGAGRVPYFWKSMVLTFQTRA